MQLTIVHSVRLVPPRHPGSIVCKSLPDWP